MGPLKKAQSLMDTLYPDMLKINYLCIHDEEALMLNIKKLRRIGG